VLPKLKLNPNLKLSKEWKVSFERKSGAALGASETLKFGIKPVDKG